MVTVGDTSVQVEHWPVDEQYISTMGMHIVKGRNFSADLKTDSAAIILNESAITMMGITADPLGKIVEDGDKRYHVIGVVKDFNFNSLRDNVTPLSLVLGQLDLNAVLCIRLKTLHLSGLMDQIEGKWRQRAPRLHFDYSFIVVLLSRDFMRWTLIAFAIAAPLAWWAMHRWLRGFAYRVVFPWQLLAVAGATAVAIAFVTISFQSLKAANANPIKSLRSE